MARPRLRKQGRVVVNAKRLQRKPSLQDCPHQRTSHLCAKRDRMCKAGPSVSVIREVPAPATNNSSQIQNPAFSLLLQSSTRKVTEYSYTVVALLEHVGIIRIQKTTNRVQPTARSGNSSLVSRRRSKQTPATACNPRDAKLEDSNIYDAATPQAQVQRRWPRRAGARSTTRAITIQSSSLSRRLAVVGS